MKESKKRRGKGEGGGGGYAGQSHLVLSLIIACAGAALNNDSVGEQLISVATLLSAASIVLLKLFSVFVLISVVLVLNQKCERPTRFRTSKNK